MNIVRLNRALGRYVGPVFGRQMTFLAEVVEDLFGTLPETLKIYVDKDHWYGITVLLEPQDTLDEAERYYGRKAVHEGSDAYLALSLDLVNFLEEHW